MTIKGADVNAKNKYGETPLDIAHERGYTKVVGLLIQHTNQEENSKKQLDTAAANEVVSSRIDQPHSKLNKPREKKRISSKCVIS